MATDGIKILDSDTAHDTYQGIMDLFDNGADLEKIKDEFPIELELFDDYQYELYLTSLALAFWEIGIMNDSLIKKVKSIIEKEESIKLWTQECDKNTGNQRRQLLNRLINKISKPNEKVRKPKKYKLVTNFHFQVDDLLTIKDKNNFYRVLICAKILQYRNETIYGFIITNYKEKHKPNSKSILDYFIFGNFIGSDLEIQKMVEIQPGLDKIWEINPVYEEMFFGFEFHNTNHKHLASFKNEFEKIGSVKIKDVFKNEIVSSPTFSLEEFENAFYNLDLKYQKYLKKEATMKWAPIKILIDE